MNRILFKQFDAIATKALEQFCQDQGLRVQVRRKTGAYDSKTYIMKIEIADLDESGTALDQDAQTLLDIAPYLGLSKTVLGASFMSNGKAFTLVGYRSKSPKYPFLGEALDGKRFKFTDTLLVDLMKRFPKTA